MKIKQIFDEIANESSTKQKMVILGKYKDSNLLRTVLFLANTKRVKFYIKQIPEYVTNNKFMPLHWAIEQLEDISNREVTGDAARAHLQYILSSVASDDAYIVERIIDKDCKIGMGTSNMNKVFPKLIEDTPYMGAKSFSPDLAKKILEDGPAYSDIKMDGRYCNALIRSGDVELESRQGEPTILTGAKFLEELAGFPDCVLNGELTMDGVSRYESNGIISSLIDIMGKVDNRSLDETAKKLKAFKEKHGEIQAILDKITFTVWDTITIDEYFATKSSDERTSRFESLKTLLKHKNATMVRVIETTIVKTYEEAIAHFQDVLNKGFEGTILKSRKGTWKDGKPNWQVKMKLEMDVDLKIVGFEYGSKGTKNEKVISTLLAESSDGIVKTSPSNMTEEMMQYVTDNQERLLGTIVEVKCSGLSQDKDGNYSLLHPRFKSLRNDKATCDSFETIKEIEAMAKGLA